jgi:hypothetical protein
MKAAAASFATAALLGASAAAQAFDGVVTRVSDGDTLWVQPDDAARRPLKLRLHGIDAPELCQRWGLQARDALAARVLRQRVHVDVRARDNYGRALGALRVDGAGSRRRARRGADCSRTRRRSSRGGSGACTGRADDSPSRCGYAGRSPEGREWRGAKLACAGPAWERPGARPADDDPLPGVPAARGAELVCCPADT